MTKHLHNRGFDKSRYSPYIRQWIVGCSQCEAIVINGIACHEQGCVNIIKPREGED